MADLAFNPGGSLNSTPATTQSTLATNYVDFTSTTTQGWAQQYLPELMEKEAEVFGNRSVSGFLEMVGAEEAMASDQVVWSEQGRLHLAYKGNHHASTEGLITITKDIDDNDIDADTEAGHGIRVGDMVVVADASAQVKCYVSEVDAAADTATGCSITVQPYTAADLSAAGVAPSATVTVFVFGSEYTKGQDGRAESNDPKFTSYSNQPIIMKDMFHISGSDAAQIGWVEVSGEEGQSGYLWYLKAAGDTKARFADYCEMAMVEAEKANGATALVAIDSKLKGTEGLFAAIESRGNVAYDATGAGVNAYTLPEFDSILAEFDKQGAIEEYMMFLNRSSSLAIDDMLAAQSSQGAVGSSYGVFNNDSDMALNLGFSGFRRGSYDFYKSDWKYLNDKATRGGMIADAEPTGAVDGTNLGLINGVFVPAGVSTVYDQTLGKNLKRPFLHVRYRAAGNENRKFKTWTTGSVGAATSSLDAMEMHFLTERCLVVQGANNFMLLRG